MASNIIELIKVLRERTGAGMMDCKAALLANASVRCRANGVLDEFKGIGIDENKSLVAVGRRAEGDYKAMVL